MIINVSAAAAADDDKYNHSHWIIKMTIMLCDCLD
jgi:hypothetical protein